jgi:hypothetical protein
MGMTLRDRIKWWLGEHLAFIPGVLDRPESEGP